LNTAFFSNTAPGHPDSMISNRDTMDTDDLQMIFPNAHYLRASWPIGLWDAARSAKNPGASKIP
jgi:hypothetical protein